MGAAAEARIGPVPTAPQRAATIFRAVPILSSPPIALRRRSCEGDKESEMAKKDRLDHFRAPVQENQSLVLPASRKLFRRAPVPGGRRCGARKSCPSPPLPPAPVFWSGVLQRKPSTSP